MKQTVIRMSDLHPARRFLAEEMQRIRYGTIEWLPIRDGLPVFTEWTLCLPAHRIGGADGPHPASGSGDTVLKADVVDLFERFDRIGCGLVRCIKIVDGLPRDFILAERPGGGPAAAADSLFSPVRPPFAVPAVNKISRGR